MCGICGEFRTDHQPGVDRETIRRMSALLAHRGPDDRGEYLCSPPLLGLGHCRLSIIDLVGGVQPMANEDGTVRITYNGEVYNFAELREQLKNRGHEFRTDSDTEVIIHQYEEDGPECVNKFNGMFAFAIWDKKKRRLFLARDRLGIKPLYYTVSGSRFLFASEILPILSALDETPPISQAALWSYLAIQYVPSPHTMFKGIKKLRPGHMLTVDASGINESAYWKMPEDREPIRGQAAEEAIRELLDDSIKKRLVADVPLGAFLSGGIDSTALVAAMKKHKGDGIKTFSVDFHADAGADYVNETEWSKLAARTYGTDHHALTVSAKDAMDALPEIVPRLDDLISDPAVIPTYLVSKFARQKVTVVLSGEGGDELFGGYLRYALGPAAKFYQPIPKVLRHFLFEVPANLLPRMRLMRKALLALGETTPASRHLAWLLVMPPETIDAIIGANEGREMVDNVFGPAFSGQTKAFDLDRTLRTDITTWLPDDLLTKVDRASMAVGLEARVPLLDHRLVEMSLRIPPSEKVRLLQGKRIFKRALKGRVPDPIIKRKKLGFALPLDTWFRHELKDMMLDLLHPDRLSQQGFLNPEAVSAIIHEHLSGREDQGLALFSLLIFQLWHDSIKRSYG